MDWNLKAPCWDISDVDEATIPNIETMDESTRLFQFSVDLKLGQVGNSGSDLGVPKSRDANFAAAGMAKIASPPPPTASSGSYSKRARGINNGTLRASCLVDGCNSDLSACRDYHRRHKVCEQHSKTPEVTINGLKQRFCQQCSRFHSLEQFDEGKRSCRKRLDGHNRRRRKAPQPASLTRPASSLSNYQGTQLLPLSSPHVYSPTAMGSPAAWSGRIVTPCADSRILQNHHQIQHQLRLVDHRQDLFLGTCTSTLLNNSQTLPPPPPNSDQCQALLLRTKMFCDGGSVHDTPSALSLLSSSSSSSSMSQTHTHTHENIGLNQLMVHYNPHHTTMSLNMLQRLGLSLHHSNNSNSNSNSSGSLDHCSSSMYGSNLGGSDHGMSLGNNDEAPQLFPFQWE